MIELIGLLNYSESSPLDRVFFYFIYIFLLKFHSLYHFADVRLLFILLFQFELEKIG